MNKIRRISKEELRDYYHLRRLAFPEKCRAATLRHYYRNKEQYLENGRKFRLNNPDYHRTKRLEYFAADPERFRNYDRKRKAYKAKYMREKRQTDLHFKLAHRLRNFLNTLLRNSCSEKTYSAIELLGCSLYDFRLYLESKFEVGMSWSNYGRGEGTWQIDHIVPCAIFDLKKPEHQKRCFHFSNMQPMWTVENQRKSRRPSSAQFNLL